MSADGTRRDPFEAAADEAFRNAPEPTDGPKRDEAVRDAGGFGRDGGGGETEFAAPRTTPTREHASTSEPGDIERPVPPEETGSPFDADPTGERFRSGAFDNEPGWLEPGPKNAQLCYWLNLAGFVVWPLPLVSAVMAAVNRSKVGAPLATHYTYALRTVPLAILYGLLAYALGRLAGLALLAVVVWFVWRNLSGLARVGAGEPIHKPAAWLI